MTYDITPTFVNSRYVYTTLLLCSFIFLQSCGTIMTQRKQAMYFSTEPQGAKVFFNKKFLGTTPCSVKVPRRAFSHTIYIEKEGLNKIKIPLKTSWNGWAYLNIPFFYAAGIGIPGLLVDLIGGGGLEYKENYYDIDIAQKQDRRFNTSR